MIILPQPWCLGLWAGPTLWGTFVLACSLSQEKIRNYHPGSICFPGSLNLPIWSVCHPNAWWVSCHPGCHPVTLLLGKVPPRRMCWAVCATWELHPTLTPSFSCGRQKRIYSDTGAERRKGMSKHWACELGAVRHKRKVSWLWTVDYVLTLQP